MEQYVVSISLVATLGTMMVLLNSMFNHSDSKMMKMDDRLLAAMKENRDALAATSKENREYIAAVMRELRDEVKESKKKIN